MPTKVAASHPYYNLGPFTLAISTSNPSTQTWFTRGLTWLYAFNHAEAASCFTQAILHDPTCAMAHWGLAYAVGPNYNKPWERFDARDRAASAKIGYEAARRAKAAAGAAAETSYDHEGGVTVTVKVKPWERAVIGAMQRRFEGGRPPKDPGVVNARYARAMGRVYEVFGHGGDEAVALEIAVLYADALMNITPWALWDLETGAAAKNAPTALVGSVLDDALGMPGADKHPGLLHLYIHYVEMSPTPDSKRALDVANQLRGLVPDAGHIHHMPTHLDILVGDWQRSIEGNYNATIADERYLAGCESGAYNLYTFYRLHNYHSLIYAAMFAGQKKTALDAVARMEKSVPDWSRLLSMTSPPMADWLENFLGTRVHVLIRFGMWNELLALPLPPAKDQDLLCVTTATTAYGRALAHAARGDIPAANAEQALFEERKSRVPPSRRAYNCKALDTLAVASAMLSGEIAYRQTEYDCAWHRLRRSVQLDDNLPYSEPWAWMQPARHAYAALLLEQGYIQEAAAEYRADLGVDERLIRPRRHPRNVWALSGYHECLRRLGRAGGEEGVRVQRELSEALGRADIRIRASCFCALDADRNESLGCGGKGKGDDNGSGSGNGGAKVQASADGYGHGTCRERDSRL
ncbi:uncharacterized protein DSM5745_10381 [Aspergillus mulundensis]|uniref:TPR protein n=1 Tax=Aspergillus mulundensis TaxID=1810919 RepID=A0A3D8QIV3_9EURO|nr:Uncharacterized protein DSM5745_10381 [Aspergillus mulundensis]RDW61709.1 Uncharacterized protein DSM5745_10381 [Aspergillus mulundensis]